MPTPRLTQTQVLRAAMDLADAGGLEAVSMRRVAQELGVEAMSLYHHVASKEELLRGLVDLVVGEIEVARPGTEWKSGLRRMAMSARDALVRHPWAAPLMLSHSDRSTARLRYMESMLATLRQGGFSPELTDHAYHVLDSHVVGFSLWVAGMNLPAGEDLAALAATFLEQLPVHQFPYVAEHVDHHLHPPALQAKSSFEFGLDLLLEGLEAMRARDLASG
ncbi:MAG TPA: TetR/AcrR family transcriptional regulator C-terminal domain-containing protein [Candidatus Binatia bacterium]|nr:TetR/AcrR family transcriptional regulator C-terminal domain-containing protein [Candidatus Binatia bacterium]